MKSSIAGRLRITMVVFGLLAGAGGGFAQGTMFTYQGRLNDGPGAANGTYDLTFSLYNAATNGGLVAGPLTNTEIGVTNGMFLASLDFGSNVFMGPGYWLQIGVRTNGGGVFSPLTPRQRLTPSPYAVFATTAGNAATLASGQAITGINGHTDQVILAAGSNISIATAGNTFTVAATPTPATGAASGDLSGAYPNPTMANTVQARADLGAAGVADNNVLGGSNRFSGSLIATNRGNVLTGSLAGNAGGGNITNLYRSIFNVRDFGAKGDGVTDDTAAIRAAFSQWTNFWGTLYFPAGRYLDKTQHSLGYPGGNLTRMFPARIVGDGSGSSIWLAAMTNGCLLRMTNFAVSLQGLAVIDAAGGAGDGTNSGYWIDGDTTGPFFQDIEFSSFQGYGMGLQACSFSTMSSGIFQSNNIGLRVPAYSDGTVGNVRLNRNAVGIEIGGANVQLNNLSINATRWYLSGAGNGIAAIVGDSHGVVLEGAIESSTNCCIALGYPPGFNETNHPEYSIQIENFTYLDDLAHPTNVFIRLYSSPVMLMQRNCATARINILSMTPSAEFNFAGLFEGVFCVTNMVFADGTSTPGGYPIYYQTINLPEQRYLHTNGQPPYLLNNGYH